MRDSGHPDEIIISPNRSAFDMRLRELWRYKDLIFLLVRRDFTIFYKQTVLGPIWYLLHPLLTTSVYVIIFNRIAQLSTDGAPPTLFYMSGILLWTFFTAALTNTTETFVMNQNMFSKVYFPRLAIPVAQIINGLITLGVRFALFAAIMAWFAIQGYPLHLDWKIVLLPFIVAQCALLAMGVGLILSSLTTRFRDVSLLLGFALQLWMFASPIIYPLSQIPPSWRLAFSFNPMVGIVESFRAILLGGSVANAPTIVIGITLTALLLFLGLMVFGRMEQRAMDTV